jgi:hypothetical protein
MDYTIEQQLFLDMIKEAKALLHSETLDYQVYFDDYHCNFILSPKKSMSYYPPMIAIYPDNELLVVKDWIKDVVFDFLPTIMRMYAYYYTFGFYKYKTEGVTIQPYPHDKDAVSFSVGLCLLKGVVPIETLQFCSVDSVCRLLTQYTNHKYKLVETTTATLGKSMALSLSDEDNRRLSVKWNYISSQTQNHKLDIRLGTKENPFNNIDEAIDYVQFLEREEVLADPYLNSELIQSDYRYDCGWYETKDSNVFGGIYKIPWASGETALVNNGFPKSSFVVTQLMPSLSQSKLIEWMSGTSTDRFIPLFSLKPNLYNRRFLFRGQTEEYTIKGTDIPTCVPNAYRPYAQKDNLPFRIKSYEIISLITRHPLVQLLGIKGIEIFNEPFRFQLNLRGLAQHYYNSTTLLDLTSDIDVAKFFATCTYSDETDSYIPCSAVDKLGVLYIYDIRYLNDFKSTGLPQLSTIGKQYVFPRSAMQAGFLLDMPEGLNLHDCPNVYRVYFKHDKTISDKVAKESNYGEKYFPKDCLKSIWGNKRNAPNEDFVLSRKARELYMILHPRDYKNMAELDDALRQHGFRLGDNLWPEIPQDILDEYYANALETWQKFCEDVYFAGTEGVFMKNALINLPNNKSYRQYFYK